MNFDTRISPFHNILLPFLFYIWFGGYYERGGRYGWHQSSVGDLGARVKWQSGLYPFFFWVVPLGEGVVEVTITAKLNFININSEKTG
jgi:hypothetical protein